MKPILYVLCGVSGSGKTTYANNLINKYKNIHIGIASKRKTGICAVDSFVAV